MHVTDANAESKNIRSSCENTWKGRKISESQKSK